MATSGTVDWSLTSRQIISRALKNIGAVAIGATPNAEDAEEAMTILNEMVKTWGTLGLLFQKTEGSVTLVASTGSYASSPVSLARRINGVRRRTSNIDTELDELSREEYLSEPPKTATGMPRAWYFDPQRATRTLYLIGVPDATIAASTTLRIDYDRAIEDVDALDNDPDFPQEWMEALIYGLSARLLIPYSVHATDGAKAQKIEERASVLFAQLSSDSQETASVFFSPSHH